MGHQLEFSGKEVRTRIAPSPTGFFHIGTARTALFNYLFAKKYNGSFVVRIEDTDEERSEEQYVKDALESMKWLGILWDEGPDIGGAFEPYRQSERIHIYKTYLDKLVEEKHAYPCFCKEDEIELIRADQMARGEAPKYNGRCRNLSTHEVNALKEKNENYVLRFKMPEKIVSFKDLVKDEIKFDTSLFGDIPIAKSSGVPLYNFAVVIDDFLMKITHVIRGEDHISNTPKQIMIADALKIPKPYYAHIPLILGPDRTKLSKRHGAMSIMEYRSEGFLPEALVNFMAFLGFNPKDNREIFGMSELIHEFSLPKVQRSGAIFNVIKLEWLNNHYLKTINLKRLVELSLSYFRGAKLIGEGTIKKDELRKIEQILQLERGRIKKLSEVVSAAEFFFRMPVYEKELLKWKDGLENDTAQNLTRIQEAIHEIPDSDFTENILRAKIQILADTSGNGAIYWPLRVALSGLKSSPPPIEIALILGKEESLERIRQALILLQ